MDPSLFNKMTSIATNYYTTQNKGQGFLLAPPPLRTRERKNPQDCFLSYIDQIQDGLYTSSKLVRNEPRINRDTYFVVRTSTTQVRSYRRNYSHRNVALFKTKAGGATRKNIEYMSGSFLEMDGTTDSKIKTQGDVLALISRNNLPQVSYTIETSKGHFHVIWNYNNPLPWTIRNESFWLAQQKRLIQLFQKDGFNVDEPASTNPCQNLRNPSQRQPYNYKRRCEVVIHTSYQKTSLRAIYKALNETTIPNPTPMKASVKLRRFLRRNETFTLTHQELAINLGIALSTAERIVKRAVANGDMLSVGKVGNNKGITRATRYRSGLYLEPQFSEPSHSISKNNALRETSLLEKFKRTGAKKGQRNKTIFALGLSLKAQLGKRACIGAIRDELLQGGRACHVREKEFERTLRNVMKPIYDHHFSLAKMRDWGLLEPEHSH